MIIWKANKYQGPMNVLRGPGRIIDVSESGIVVSVVDGYLLISEYELEKPLSKKEINQLKFFDLT